MRSCMLIFLSVLIVASCQAGNNTTSTKVTTTKSSQTIGDVENAGQPDLLPSIPNPTTPPATPTENPNTASQICATINRQQYCVNSSDSMRCTSAQGAISCAPTTNKSVSGDNMSCSSNGSIMVCTVSGSSSCSTNNNGYLTCVLSNGQSTNTNSNVSGQCNMVNNVLHLGGATLDQCKARFGGRISQNITVVP